MDLRHPSAHAAALEAAHRHALAWLDGLRERRVHPGAGIDAVARFAGPLPEHGEDPATVVEALVAAAEPGLVASAGPRYFGYVIGGGLPSTVAADQLAVAWDQVAGLEVM
ncbi:MAG: aspartate aminotransferase family protein, partial [Oryzihumus sp.]